MSKLSANEDDPEKSVVSRRSVGEKPNLNGDWLNLALLTILYTLQGLLYGLSLSLPIIFQSKKVSYRDQIFRNSVSFIVLLFCVQALYNFVFWPYTFKLLWAPLVDALYIQWIGRRKSWLLPVQYITGMFLLYTASNIDVWLSETEKPNVKVLTYVFTTVIFLVSLQDNIVDGWALTLLKKNNVSYASTANWTGFSFGQFFGFMCPILLTSEDFCNAHLRITPSLGGIIEIRSFLYFLGILFILITTLVGIFKTEKDNRLEDNYVKINVLQNYKLLWDILNLPSIRVLAIAILTMRLGFSATHALSNLKLIDAGLPKDDITMISALPNIAQIVVPLIVSKYTSGPKPISVCLKMTIIRLLWCLTYVALIYYTPSMLVKYNDVVFVPTYYYFTVGLISVINEVVASTSLVAVMAFFNRISDRRYGSTYMTLLNTVNSTGLVGSTTLALSMVDILTFKKCSVDARNSCSTSDLKNTCYVNGGSCTTIVDGYYAEVGLCLIIGFVWYSIFRNILKHFQEKPLTFWLVDVNRPNTHITA